jgi:hypothetical protein
MVSSKRQCSVAFGNTLQSVGAKATTILYARKTHTDLFLQVCYFAGLYRLLSESSGL